MKLLNTLNYEKPDPHRDSTLFIIICEGAVRELDYFDYFDKLSRQIRVHAYSPDNHKSSPNHVLDTAYLYLEKYKDQNDEEGFDEERDQFWLVMDTDHHRDLIHEVVNECNQNQIMNYVISNPCFEVWLWYHFREDRLPDTVDTCDKYKAKVSKLNQNGGFDSARHSTFIKVANTNSKNNFQAEGYMPKVGSTTLFELGEQIFERVKGVLREYNN